MLIRLLSTPGLRENELEKEGNGMKEKMRKGERKRERGEVIEVKRLHQKDNNNTCNSLTSTVLQLQLYYYRLVSK